MPLGSLGAIIASTDGHCESAIAAHHACAEQGPTSHPAELLSAFFDTPCRRTHAGFLSSPASFNQVRITFTPKADEVADTELQCDNDIAVCNRECEKLYSAKTAEFEEPCKMAVQAHFGVGGSACAVQ